MTVDTPNITAVRATPTRLFYRCPDHEVGMEYGQVRQDSVGKTWRRKP